LLAGRASEAGLTLAGFTRVDATVYELSSPRKNEIIAELVDKLVEVGVIGADQSQAVANTIVDREKLGSTAVGRGVAIPHAKHPAVPDVVAVVGRSREGVDFGALDGEPVNIIFLVVAPPNAPTRHLRVLEHIAWLLRDGTFFRRLRDAESHAEMMELILQAENA